MLLLHCFLRWYKFPDLNELHEFFSRIIQFFFFKFIILCKIKTVETVMYIIANARQLYKFPKSKSEINCIIYHRIYYMVTSGGWKLRQIVLNKLSKLGINEIFWHTKKIESHIIDTFRGIFPLWKLRGHL